MTACTKYVYFSKPTLYHKRGRHTKDPGVLSEKFPASFPGLALWHMYVPTPATRKVWVTRDFSPPLNVFCSVSSVLISASAVTAGSLIMAYTCLLRSFVCCVLKYCTANCSPCQSQLCCTWQSRYLESASTNSFRTFFESLISNRSFLTGLHGRCISAVANALAMLLYSIPSSLAARQSTSSDDRAFA